MNSSELSLLNLLFYNPRSSFRFGFRRDSAACLLFAWRLVFHYLVPYGLRFPVKSSTSRPSWAPAADAVLKIDNEWGGGRATAFKDMPPHKNSQRLPEGGNHLYMDGSVSWVNFNKMLFLHSWSTGGARDAYFFQEDIPEELIPKLDLIRAKY